MNEFIGARGGTHKSVRQVPTTVAVHVAMMPKHYPEVDCHVKMLVI